MPETSRIKWPFPREFEDPWYDTFVSFIEAVDSTVYTTREDRNLLLMGGGTVAFNVSGTDGLLSWSQALSLLSPIAGLLLSVPPATVNLLDGEMLYANVTRAPTSPITLSLIKARNLPNTNDALLLAVRRGSLVYWRGGKVIANGDAFALFEQSSGTSPSVTYVPLSSHTYRSTLADGTATLNIGAAVWHPAEHAYAGRTIKLRLLLSADLVSNAVRAQLWSVTDGAYVTDLDGSGNLYMQTSALTPTELVSRDLSGVAADNFDESADGRVYEIHISSTNAATLVVASKAELVIGL